MTTKTLRLPDDIVSGVLAILDRVPAPEDDVPHRVYNIGNHRPEQLLHFIEVLAKAIGREPTMNMLPMQTGDVYATFADISALQEEEEGPREGGREEGQPSSFGARASAPW